MSLTINKLVKRLVLIKSRRENVLEMTISTASVMHTIILWTLLLTVSSLSRQVVGNAVPKTSDNDIYNSEQLQSFWKGEGTFEEIRRLQGQVMKKFMDTTANPCEDFYQYACGNWEKYNPVPEDEADFNMFTIVYYNINDIMKELLMQTANGSVSDNDAINKAKNFYASCMNLEVLKKRGVEPLLEFVERYGGWPVLNPEWKPDNFDWSNLTAHFSLYGKNILLYTSVTEDLKNSSENIIFFYEPSLGLQNRNDYLLEANANHLTAYRNFIETLLSLLSVSPELAKIAAKEIVDFETQLAKILSDPKKRPDINEMYQGMTVGELHEKHPQVNWTQYLSIVQEMPISQSQPIVLLTENYIGDLIELLSKTDKKTLANYIMFRFIRQLVTYLDDRFDEAILKLDEALTGQKVLAPRWKDCVSETNEQMGMAVGAMFVKKYFDESSKKEVMRMTRDLRQSFEEILTDATWIDEPTKKIAIEKAEAITLEVGYPDFILSSEKLNKKHEGITIDPEKYFENTLNLLRHETNVERQKLYKTVDKNEWPIYPSVVNAFFEQTKNRIIIPAGILQLPFYHHHFPQSLKYGGMGVLIGHELTHGFDDRGRNFDLKGNMQNWWTNTSILSFKESAQCFIEQYNNYSFNGKSLYGASSQGENIADNGGIRQSFHAYKKWLEKNKDSADLQFETFPELDLTGTQLFFVAFAQTWCSSIRPEAVETVVGTNRHCPGKYRAIGTISNFEEFANEFKCPLGSPMNPEKKCKIW